MRIVCFWCCCCCCCSQSTAFCLCIINVQLIALNYACKTCSPLQFDSVSICIYTRSYIVIRCRSVSTHLSTCPLYQFVSRSLSLLCFLCIFSLFIYLSVFIYFFAVVTLIWNSSAPTPFALSNCHRSPHKNPINFYIGLVSVFAIVQKQQQQRHWDPGVWAS